MCAQGLTCEAFFHRLREALGGAGAPEIRGGAVAGFDHVAYRAFKAVRFGVKLKVVKHHCALADDIWGRPMNRFEIAVSFPDGANPSPPMSPAVRSERMSLSELGIMLSLCRGIWGGFIIFIRHSIHRRNSPTMEHDSHLGFDPNEHVGIELLHVFPGLGRRKDGLGHSHFVIDIDAAKPHIFLLKFSPDMSPRGSP